MLIVLARRLTNVVPTLFAVVALVFVLFSVLPGSFISGMSEEGRTIDPAVMERMRKEMGLDDPLHERFAKYVAKVATGDLGTSFRTREPVTTASRVSAQSDIGRSSGTAGYFDGRPSANAP